MDRELDDLTAALFRASFKADPSACSCGLGARTWPLSSHREDCTLNLLWTECYDEASNQLYGGPAIPVALAELRIRTSDLFEEKKDAGNLKCTCGHAQDRDPIRKVMGEHKEGCALLIAWKECWATAVKERRETPEAPPDLPAEEKGLLLAIERCQDYAALVSLAKQYCRDRFKALREKGAALLEETRLSELYAKAILDLEKARKNKAKYKTWFFKAIGERDASHTGRRGPRPAENHHAARPPKPTKEDKPNDPA